VKEEDDEKLDRDESVEETPNGWPEYKAPEKKAAALFPDPNEKPIVDREWDKKFKDWQLGTGEEPGPHPYS